MLKIVEITLLVQPYNGGSHREVVVELHWMNTPRTVLEAFPTWMCIELIRSGLSSLGSKMPQEISVDMNALMGWHFHEVEQLDLFHAEVCEV